MLKLASVIGIRSPCSPIARPFANSLSCAILSQRTGRCYGLRHCYSLINLVMCGLPVLPGDNELIRLCDAPA